MGHLTENQQLKAIRQDIDNAQTANNELNARFDAEKEIEALRRTVDALTARNSLDKQLSLGMSEKPISSFQSAVLSILGDLAERQIESLEKLSEITARLDQLTANSK